MYRPRKSARAQWRERHGVISTTKGGGEYRIVIIDIICSVCCCRLVTRFSTSRCWRGQRTWSTLERSTHQQQVPLWAAYIAFYRTGGGSLGVSQAVCSGVLTLSCLCTSQAWLQILPGCIFVLFMMLAAVLLLTGAERQQLARSSQVEWYPTGPIGGGCCCRHDCLLLCGSILSQLVICKRSSNHNRHDCIVLSLGQLRPCTYVTFAVHMLTLQAVCSRILDRLQLGVHGMCTCVHLECTR